MLCLIGQASVPRCLSLTLVTAAIPFLALGAIYYTVRRHRRATARCTMKQNFSTSPRPYHIQELWAEALAMRKACNCIARPTSKPTPSDMSMRNKVSRRSRFGQALVWPLGREPGGASLGLKQPPVVCGGHCGVSVEIDSF
jgi:hypothetical protein